MPGDTETAGVQLLHSLIYLYTVIVKHDGSWGSTLTLPDILASPKPTRFVKLGFNSYTP